MAIYQFLDFTFCDQSYHLERSGKVVNIRPKTAQAIEVFMNTPQTLVTKETLHRALWGQQHSQDYRLFQVISEIRKLDPNEPLIRTLPNQGYYWQTNVHKLPEKTPRSIKKYAVAASLLVCSFLSAGIIVKYNHALIPASPPALGSYTKAVYAYHAQDYETAQKWLYFSLQENPHSQEAKLLLAELKFSQHQIAHAKQLAEELLTENEAQSYYQGQALSLLSRIATTENNFNDALDFALRGKKSAEQGLAICSAQMFDQQIAALVDQQQIEPLKQSIVTQAVKHQATSKKPESTLLNDEHAELCKQLKQPVTSKLECKNSQYEAMLARTHLSTRTHLTT